MSPASASRSASDGRTSGPLRGERVKEQGGLDVHRADVTRQDDHADAALQDRGFHRQLGDPGHLGRRHDVAEVAGAVQEDEVGAGLLEVARPDLGPRDVRHDGEHRGAVAIAVVQPVEKVEAAWARGAQDGGRVSRDLGVGPSGEGAGLLVADVDEAQLAIGPADGVGDGVGRVADHAIHVANASPQHQVDEFVCDRLRHRDAPRRRRGPGPARHRGAATGGQAGGRLIGARSRDGPRRCPRLCAHRPASRVRCPSARVGDTARCGSAAAGVGGVEGTSRSGPRAADRNRASIGPPRGRFCPLADGRWRRAPSARRLRLRIRKGPDSRLARPLARLTRLCRRVGGRRARHGSVGLTMWTVSNIWLATRPVTS